MKILIISGGSIDEMWGRKWVADYEPDYCIAADSGLVMADKLGLTVDLLLGDYDSVDKKIFEKYNGNTKTITYPCEKDYTDTTDNENIIEQLTTGSNYENSNEKYQDNLSSAITFLVCGIGGLIVVLLNDIGILKFFTYKGASGILTNVVLIGMFVAFIIIAAISFKAAKKAKSNISTEEKTNYEIQDWLTSNITADMIDASYDGSQMAEEMKYFSRSSYIKNEINKKYPDLNDDIVDSIADEYIEKIF
jgi:flagellar basal body-associated protein FliL